VPHLRIEDRALPAGPTVIDVLANAAFFFGAMRGLTELDRSVWSELPFHVARNNLYAGARLGMDSLLYWPGIGWTGAAHAVTAGTPTSAQLRNVRCRPERYLTVIEQRCAKRHTGASWQRAAVQTLTRTCLILIVLLVGLIWGDAL
jgi:hypothetical protein